MGHYGDLRDQMHPGVAKTVPSTPEATAIINGEYVKPLAFGGLVTALVEDGAVEVGSINDIRDSVCKVLGIKPDEFDRRLQDPEVIDARTADEWQHTYRERAEAELVQRKSDEAMRHLTNSVLTGIKDTGDELQNIITEQRDVVDTREKTVQELEESGSSYVYAVQQRAKLDAYLRPKLAELETSTFAVRLSDLLSALHQSTWFNQQGTGFALDVLGNFRGYSDRIKDAAIYEQDIQELYEDTGDERVADAAHSLWLPESEIKLLARSYGECYYGILHTEAEAPGREELGNLPNPVEKALFVSEEDKAAFFIAFPLANGNRPV